MTRIDGRAPDELRPIIITPNYLSHPLASVLISCGNTRVVCAASVDAKVPPWMKAQKGSRRLGYLRIRNAPGLHS